MQVTTLFVKSSRLNMKRIKIGLLNVIFIVFLTSCLTAGTTDVSADNQSVYSQAKVDSTISDSIQHILSEVVNDGKAPGMIAAIISGEGVIAVALQESVKRALVLPLLRVMWSIWVHVEKQ